MSSEHDALRQRRSLDTQIMAALGGTKIGDRRTRSPAVPRRGLEKAGAFLRRAVESRLTGKPASAAAAMKAAESGSG
jgi:hypothetical protein